MKSPSNKDAVIARYFDGPKLLERALAGLREADLDTVPSKGGWTIRQIVRHLVDGDDIWKMCIKQAFGNDQSEFSLDWYRVLPQDTWVDRWAYALFISAQFFSQIESSYKWTQKELEMLY